MPLFTVYDVGFSLFVPMTLLPKNVKPPKTALISVDPARDTPEELARYVKSNGFPSDIVGLTGTLDELHQVASEFAAPLKLALENDKHRVRRVTLAHG